MYILLQISHLLFCKRDIYLQVINAKWKRRYQKICAKITTPWQSGLFIGVHRAVPRVVPVYLRPLWYILIRVFVIVIVVSGWSWEEWTARSWRSRKLRCTIAKLGFGELMLNEGNLLFQSFCIYLFFFLPVGIPSILWKIIGHSSCSRAKVVDYY